MMNRHYEDDASSDWLDDESWASQRDVYFHKQKQRKNARREIDRLMEVRRLREQLHDEIEWN